MERGIHTGYELTKIWTAVLEEQNGTERMALMLYPYPEGPPILAIDLQQDLHPAAIVDVVVAALRPELEKIEDGLRKDAAVIHCPVAVRDAQKDGHVLYDLYAAIRAGEKAAVSEACARARAKADNAKRRRESQPTWEDVLEHLEKAEFALDYVQGKDRSLDSPTLSSIWRQLHAIRQQALKVRRTH